MVKAVGVDIEEVKRFRQLPYSKNRLFYHRIFTPREIKYCLAKSDPYPHFAARFCAKEAIIKTLKKERELKAIEVMIEKGKPQVRLAGRREKRIILSLTHTREYALALALAQ